MLPPLSDSSLKTDGNMTKKIIRLKNNIRLNEAYRIKNSVSYAYLIYSKCN